MIVTFYSFKGGVGRSMAMVNAGEILADRGYNVVLCDWDLEAPGLERYLLQTEDGSTEGESEWARLVSSRGLVDLIAEFKQKVALPPPKEPKLESDQALLGRIPLTRPSSLAMPVSTRRDRPGSLRLLSAGRRDGENEAKYAEFVTRFDWEDFYNRWAGGSYIEFLREDLVGNPDTRGACDILLIDSRTGVTEQGGICTHHLADLVVLLSAANQANLKGTEWMARSLDSDKLKALRGDREIEVLPVRARIDDSAQVYELAEFRNDFMAEMRHRYPKSLTGLEDLALRLEIPYRALYSFQERAIAREPVHKREQKLYDAYSTLADSIITVGRARKLLSAKDTRTAELVPVRERMFSPEERPGLVLVTSSPSEQSLAEAVVNELRDGGFHVVASSETTPARWLRQVKDADRFLTILDPAESEKDRIRIAPLLRAQALDATQRVIPLVRNRKSIAPFTGQCITVPEDMDAGFFAALREEIAAENGARLRTLGDVKQPFPGSSPYQESDSPFFFGRDDELVEVVSAWTGHHRWLDVSGASGVGKTSFVQAALVPAIRAGYFPSIPQDVAVVPWPIVRGAHCVAPEVIAPTVLLMEGLDELLLGQTRMRAFGSVHPIAALLSRPVWLISTSTRTYRKQLDELEEMAGEAGLLHYDLRELSAEAVRHVIAGAVRLAGRSFEPGLTDRLADQLVTWRGTPVFISEPMRRLLDKSRGSVLTHDLLKSAGGVAGLVSAAADNALETVEAAGMRPAMVIDSLLQLVTADGASRSRMIKEVAEFAGNEVGVYDIAASGLAKLDERVDIANPQLSSWWRRLADAMTERREQLVARDAIENVFPRLTDERLTPYQPLRVWSNRLPKLAEAAGASLPRRARDFVRRTVVINRVLAAYLIIGALALLGVLISGPIREWLNAPGEKARRATLVRNAAEQTQDPVSALILAMHAVELSDDDANITLLQAAMRNASCRAIYRPSNGVTAMALNSETIVFADKSAELYTYEYKTEKLSEPLRLGGALPLAVTADGTRVALGHTGGIRIYSAEGNRLFDFTPQSVVTSLAHPPLRNTPLAIGESNGAVTIVAEGERLGADRIAPPRPEPVISVAITIDPIRIAAMSKTGENYRIRLWEFDEQNGWQRMPWRVTAPGEAKFSDAPFSKDGGRIAWTSVDGVVHVWATDTLKDGYVLDMPGKETVAAFDRHENGRIAVGTDSGVIYVHQFRGDTPSLSTRAILRGHTAPIVALRYNETVSGPNLLSVDASGQMRVWDFPAESETLPSDAGRLLDEAQKRLPAGIDGDDRRLMQLVLVKKIPGY